MMAEADNANQQKEEPTVKEAKVDPSAAVGTSSQRPGFGTVTAYFMANDQLDDTVTFVQTAFGATETYRAQGSAGGWHVELQIGDARIMLGGRIQAQLQDKHDKDIKKAIPTMLFLYVFNTDAVYQTALAAGATSLMEPAANFQEHRGAAVVDPCGNTWFLATHDPTTTHIHA